MTFEEKVEEIYAEICRKVGGIEITKIEKSKVVISSIMQQYKVKSFNKNFIQKSKIHQALCYAITNTLIDVSDIYILKAFISNISNYTIDIKHLQINYEMIAYTINNCENDNTIIMSK